MGLGIERVALLVNAVGLLTVIAGAVGAVVILSIELPVALKLVLAGVAAFAGIYAGALMIGFAANLRILSRISRRLDAIDRM